jgi:hypothetical protein
MRYILILVMSVVLTGCGGLFSQGFNSLPTTQNCQHVEYVRDGKDVTIQLKCTVPPPNPAGLSLMSVMG